MLGLMDLLSVRVVAFSLFNESNSYFLHLSTLEFEFNLLNKKKEKKDGKRTINKLPAPLLWPR